ncbi:hypothetical protein PMAYCL1PPCAC_17126 [Pristionchus mayeri]|uniref:Uncharacterized protein n=1 Tax=Pristionchus mayeri TaxID=1317129 RepID=A0AAN5CM52_9BILA|nr:hypothetical protein PMAYCL1PPCAC_17126 [Pristionchus mayeri]
MFEKREETALESAFVAFARAAEVDRVCPKMNFVDYARDTKTRKVRAVDKMIGKMIESVAPGSETEMRDRVCKTGRYGEWDGMASQSTSGILEQVNHLWMQETDARTRDIILSVVAGPMTFGQVLPFFPGLSNYMFTNAKRIWASQEIPPEVLTTRDGWATKNSLYFIHYLTSGMTQMPFGTKSVKLSTGERIEISNMIRQQSKAETIRGFKQFMEEQDLSEFVYSDSTMMRFLNAAPSTQRKAMQCVDSFKAFAYEAFDEIKDMIDWLLRKGKIDKEDSKKMWNEWMEIRLYLKHDYSMWRWRTIGQM